MRPLAFALALLAAPVLALLAAPLTAQAPEWDDVDLELVLLADATGSIDPAEIAFQRRGYAEAITSPEVLSAVTGGAHRKIVLTYVEWAAAQSQDVAPDKSRPTSAPEAWLRQVTRSGARPATEHP